MEKNYSKEIARCVDEFLTSDDWKYSFDEDRGIFKFGLSLRGRIKSVSYAIDVKENCYIAYAISPIGADADDKLTMSRMAEYICRTNYGLKNGNFELDMRDGEIRFKIFVDCDGAMPSGKIIRNSIYCPAAMFELYGDGILNVIFAGEPGDDEIDETDEFDESDRLDDDMDDDDIIVDESNLEEPSPAELVDIKRDIMKLSGFSDTSTESSDRGTTGKVKLNLFETEGEDE